MRINKFLSRAGVCSRRAADDIISKGQVKIDGRVATLGDEVTEDSRVTVKGRPVDTSLAVSERVILIYNKPAGLICSASDRDGETIFDRIDYPKRLFCAGRLDKDSRGMLILTNDGDLAEKLMRPRHGHEREYQVQCEKAVTDEMIEAFRKGVYLHELEVKTRPCKVYRTGDKSFSIILTQGLNRQIRRMCREFGVPIRDLCRVRIENLILGRLKEGTYRKLRKEERDELLASL